MATYVTKGGKETVVANPESVAGKQMEGSESWERKDDSNGDGNGGKRKTSRRSRSTREGTGPETDAPAADEGADGGTTE